MRELLERCPNHKQPTKLNFNPPTKDDTEYWSLSRTDIFVGNFSDSLGTNILGVNISSQHSRENSKSKNIQQVSIIDNSSSFTSTKFQQFLEKYGIEHLLTPSYTPQSNDLIECSNTTIIAVLSKFTLEYPYDWDKKLPVLTLAISTIQQSSLKYSPFYLLHAYDPRIISSDINLGISIPEITRELQLDELPDTRRLLKTLKKA
ncbi:Integrase, catalytic core,Ribonuclease H-like domain [Cinara cedri]|uniref:Integrase, catalytic core,Ribonuclease H-like domain n=1 Tax=Cinara cedri TaxID=506608 RepID=A0A5E4M226_9HEMI|nr:Integrase, catalytic core,Ribonuclease H-like domain [Cinara cedri]